MKICLLIAVCAVAGGIYGIPTPDQKPQPDYKGKRNCENYYYKIIRKQKKKMK